MDFQPYWIVLKLWHKWHYGGDMEYSEEQYLILFAIWFSFNLI